MRGPAAPTSPGAWDARSEALLGTPALTPPPGLDLRAPESPAPPPATDPDHGDDAGPTDHEDRTEPAQPAGPTGPPAPEGPAPSGIAAAPEAAVTPLPEPGPDRPTAPP
ncbi:hypothetical protein ACWGK1_40790, partial [Streptomyces wedmorensis]